MVDGLSTVQIFVDGCVVAKPSYFYISIHYVKCIACCTSIHVPTILMFSLNLKQCNIFCLLFSKRTNVMFLVECPGQLFIRDTSCISCP